MAVSRKLTTILCADVEGYSRLMGGDEVATLDRLKQHRSAMAGLIERHRGRVVNTWGDGLIADFPSVVEAVQCAIETQRELATRNNGLPEPERMEFRIGINLGDVMVDGGDLYGEGVNVAARLQALAPPGGIVISGVAAKLKTRLRQLVYLDSAIVEDGDAWSTAHTPELQAQRRKLAEPSGGVSMPVPKAEVFGVTRPEDISWVQRRLTPQPFAPYDQKMHWGGPVGNGVPKVYVDCTEPAYAGLAPVKERIRGRPEWPFIELKTGHDAMVSAPGETAQLLLRYA